MDIIKKEVDAGSYGSISLVRVNGMICIEKRLLDILVGLNGFEQVSEVGKQRIAEKFYEECALLCKMRHPNIVQFIGIHYYGHLNEKHKMSLLMEYLPTSLDKCILKCREAKVTIPVSIKISILRDVAYGLSHLHANEIIHRDLSVANILLTDSMRAKVADLGVSKFIPTNSYVKFTTAPGAQYIMPPEALQAKPQYSTKLDIFSYGILLLFLMLQKIPIANDLNLKPEHIKNKHISIGRQEDNLKEVQKMNVALKEIALLSLLDDPEARPDALKLSESITMCYRNAGQDFYSDLSQFIKLIEKKILVSECIIVLFDMLI